MTEVKKNIYVEELQIPFPNQHYRYLSSSHIWPRIETNSNSTLKRPTSSAAKIIDLERCSLRPVVPLKDLDNTL